MHLTLRQMEIFEAVARLKSFTQAAKQLHLSQPAVSMQVKQLEDSVGLPLVEQIGKQIFLTDAGKEMYGYTRSISELLEEADNVFDALKGGESGQLSISVATTASHFATRLLAAFSKLHEDVNISLDITNRETLRQQIESNERDLVIMGRPPADMDVEAEAFMDNPLVMIASPSHPLYSPKKIPLSTFESESFVVREQGSGTRGATERFFKERGITFHPGIEMSSNEAIKQAVEAGLGLGIVSIHTLELELENGRLAIMDVEEFPILRHWYIIHRRGKRLSPVAQAFKDFVISEAKNF